MCCIAASTTGCTRKTAAPNPCSTADRGSYEVRTREGVPELIVKATEAAGSPGTPGAQIVCDGSAHLLGSFVRSGGSLEVRNPAGAVEATITANAGDDPVLTHGETKLRLHEESGLVRILDGQGVPVGQLGTSSGKGVAYDPGGSPIATAESVPNEDDRRAVRATDGVVTHLVLGARDDRAAAAFALERLSLVERLLLARYLDHEAH